MGVEAFPDQIGIGKVISCIWEDSVQRYLAGNPMIPVPDLLFPEPRLALDGEALNEMLELAYMGGDSGTSLEKILAQPTHAEASWDPSFFVEEIFLRDFIEDCLQVTVDGRRIPVNRVYLRQILSRPPVDLETIEFRQQILRELETDTDLRRRTQEL